MTKKLTCRRQGCEVILAEDRHASRRFCSQACYKISHKAAQSPEAMCQDSTWFYTEATAVLSSAWLPAKQPEERILSIVK